MNTCQRCSAEFEYDPNYHKCPGQWEAECAAAGAAPMPADIYAGMSWVEECMTRQYESVTQ